MNILKRLLGSRAQHSSQELPLSTAYSSHEGKRQENQDCVLFLSDERVFAVADGMGGHQAGDVAAQTAIQRFQETILQAHIRKWSWPRSWGAKPKTGSDQIMRSILGYALNAANNEVLRLMECNIRYAQMGTTFSGGVFYHHALHWIHVGDTRIYRVRDGRNEQLTVDQNYRELIRESGSLYTAKQLEQFGHRLSQHIGCESILPTFGCEPYAPGDTFLFCSDGLYESLSPIRLCAILTNEKNTANQKAHHLILEALGNGAADNITAIVVQV